jgi:predicted RNase H-like nuclease (RuvC/YqgF family)
LRYSEFVVPLVKSVQELSLENEALNSKIMELKSNNEKLEKLLLEQGMQYQNELKKILERVEQLEKVK